MYEALELVGVARKLPVAEWQSERGETVSNKEEAVRRQKGFIQSDSSRLSCISVPII